MLLNKCRSTMVVVFCFATANGFMGGAPFSLSRSYRGFLSHKRSLPLNVQSHIKLDETNEGVITSSDSRKTSPFDDFDYASCWHPVVWACDLPLNRATKVTVFDTDYVLARTTLDANGNGEDDTIIAMEDRCPHKSAALSEGRVTSGGNFQCAYHGWSFDGKNGNCVEIPQVTTSAGRKREPEISSRACGKAVPVMILQGMVWMFPGGDLEAALLAPPPPSIPEMDADGFRITRVVSEL